jgi:hypothetical protein
MPLYFTRFGGKMQAGISGRNTFHILWNQEEGWADIVTAGNTTGGASDPPGLADDAIRGDSFLWRMRFTWVSSASA